MAENDTGSVARQLVDPYTPSIVALRGVIAAKIEATRTLLEDPHKDLAATQFERGRLLALRDIAKLIAAHDGPTPEPPPPSRPKADSGGY